MKTSEEKNNSIIVIDFNDQYFGCLQLMKTNLFNPVNGMYYTILTPTSIIDKSDIQNLNIDKIQSILYFQYIHELADRNNENQVKNARKPLILISDGKFSNELYIPKEEFSNISNNNGRKITLLKPNIKLNEALASRIISTLKIKGHR